MESSARDRSPLAPTMDLPVLVAEWASKGEGDYKAAVVLNRPRKSPVPHSVCFHCHESAAKYLTAVLVSHDIRPPNTHDLLDPVSACIVPDIDAAHWRRYAAVLNPFDETVGYPGRCVSAADVDMAVDSIRWLRRLVRKKLGL
jgi:hypothetical protein